MLRSSRTSRGREGPPPAPERPPIAKIMGTFGLTWNYAGDRSEHNDSCVGATFAYWPDPSVVGARRSRKLSEGKLPDATGAIGASAKTTGSPNRRGDWNDRQPRPWSRTNCPHTVQNDPRGRIRDVK